MKSQATFTRPANTTAYAAGDVVGPASPALITFANAVSGNARPGVVRKAIVATDQGANVAVYTLHLFTTQPTAVADNAANTAPLWADIPGYVGSVVFPAAVPSGDAAYAVVKDVNLPFRCETGDDNLYGVLVTGTIFTPASGQNYALELHTASGEK